MSEPIYMTCPHCERLVTVRVNGRLRQHVDRGASKNGTPWHPVCPGTGFQVMTPEEVGATHS